MAWEHLQEVQRIALELQENPSLADDEDVLDSVPGFLAAFETHRYFHEKHAQRVLEGGPGDEFSITTSLDDPMPEETREYLKEKEEIFKEQIEKFREEQEAAIKAKQAESNSETSTTDKANETN